MDNAEYDRGGTLPPGSSLRFNKFHAKAGSATGGQFTSSSGGGGASSGHTGPAAGHGTAGHGTGTRQQLLEQAHHDLAEASTLEKQLHTLEKQHHAATAAAKHSHAQAAASKKAGHTIQHHGHVAAHKHHTQHARTLSQRITSLKGRIKSLRDHAHQLEKKAAALRAAGMITNPGGTERLHQYWVHGEGAAKIRWGEPGDFDRCVLHLGKFIRDPKGYCNLAHHAALGIYPATHAAMEHGRSATVADKTPYGAVTYADPGYQADGVKRYPLDSEEHCRAAWSYINQAGNAAKYSSEHLAAIKGRIKSALKKYGVDVSEDASRTETAPPMPFVRSFPLQDISIRAGGDGRTVDAYATVFDTPAPIHDKDGDYIEVIDRRAFDRILTKLAPAGGRSTWRCGVFYNHAMNLHGQPSDIDSMPIGVPLEIRADDHGLFTRTRYHKGDRADQVLEAIREGSLSGYSFSGAFHRSAPLVPRGGFRPDRSGNLPTVRRTESTLREYGPTPFPAYADAAITGVRSEQILAQLTHIEELLRSGTPLDEDLPDVSAAPPGEGSASEDSRLVTRSGRSVREQIQANTAVLLQHAYRR